MSMGVYKNPDDSLSVIIQEPEKTWLGMVKFFYQVDDATALELVITAGFIGIIGNFSPKYSRKELEDIDI